MKVAPISYSFFHIKENKENREILKSANPIISDVPNFYIPTIINFGKKVNLNSNKTLKNAGDSEVLSDRERVLVRERFDGDKIKTYKDIAKENGISYQFVCNAINSAALKIQAQDDTFGEDVKSFIDDFAREFKVKESKVKEIIILCPGIIPQGIEVTKEKVYGLVDRFKDEKLKKEEYLKSCLEQPQLFYHSPDTIEKNVRDLVKKFENEGLTVEAYLPACLKRPSLFYQSPDTIEKNVRDLVDKFKDEGLTTKEYLKSCVKQPQLFYLSPDTIEKNVKDVVKKFEKEGLTTKEYLKPCLKQPQLFYQSPDTIEKNVRDLVEKFENEGLTTKEYLKSCVKQPPLFSLSPNTIEKNVRDLVKKFENEGLTTKEYLDVCLKLPALFALNPNTIGEHIDILKFSRMNSEIDINDNNFFDKILPEYIDLGCSSSLLLIKYLIIPKMFEDSRIPKELKGNKLREKLNGYLKSHPKNRFTLNIKPIETNTDCFKILNETIGKIEEDVGRKDIFEINMQD